MIKRSLMRLGASCTLAMALAGATGAWAGVEVKPAPDPQQALSLDPLVKVGKLANGLTYYIRKNNRPEKKVELRLLLNVGSVVENDDQQGMAHFVEHMAFNGSRHFKKHELTSYLQSIGIKFGADLSAFTSFNDTDYILQVPTDKKEYLEAGLLVLEDWASGVTFHEADIEQERHIVLEEMRSRHGPQERMFREMLPKTLPGSKYADRYPIGREEQIKFFDSSAMKRFYRDWYRPNLMAVIAVGDIEPAQLEKKIEQHFGKLKNPPNAPPRNFTTIATPEQSEAIIITDSQASTTTVAIRYSITPEPLPQTVGDLRQKVLAQLMNQVINKRLQGVALQANAPFGAAQGGLSHIETGYQSFSVAAALNRKGIQSAIEALALEVKRLHKFGILQSELDRERKQLAASARLQYNEHDKRDSIDLVRQYNRHFLGKAILLGAEQEYQLLQQILPSISIEELNRFVLNAIPRNGPKTVSYTGIKQADALQPSRAQMLGFVNAADKANVAAPEEESVADSLLKEAPKAGSIVAQSLDASSNITTLTLSNGVKVMLRPNDYRNDEILLGAVRDGGISLFDGNDILNARYATQLVQTMGLGTLSPRQALQILAGKRAYLDIGQRLYQDTLSGGSSKADLENLLQLIHLAFSAPRRDETLYQQFLVAQNGQIRGNQFQPAAKIQAALQETLFQSHPHVALALRAEDIAKLNLDDMLRLYQQRFGSAKGFTFFLAGSFDPLSIQPLLSQYLGSLPTGELETSYRDVGLRTAQGVLNKEVRVGNDAKSTVTLTFSGPISADPEQILRYYAVIELLNLRITEVLREKQGFIYSGAASGQVIPLPQHNHLLSIVLPCGPENVNKVIASLLDEIRLMQSKGPSASDLNKVKANWLKGWRDSQKSNEYWLRQMEMQVYQPLKNRKSVVGDKMIEALSAKQLQAAAQAYLNLKNYVQIVQNPDL